MKFILVLVYLLILIPAKSLAGKGVVIVHESPLFMEKSLNSKIIQYVRQGKIIYIHGDHFGINPSEQIFSERSEIVSSKKKVTPPDGIFYQTMDNNGGTAFIPRDYVKLITNDFREEGESITIKHDNTDYRLNEPLPENYPFFDPTQYRAGITINTGPVKKDHYHYPVNITKEKYRSRMGLGLFYLKNLAENLSSRIFIGGETRIEGSSCEFKLDEQGRNSKESKKTFSIGPRISYDTFRGKKRFLSVYFNFLLNYHSNKIVQNDTITSNNSDTAKYKGYSFASHVGTLYQTEIVKNLSMVFGGDIFLKTPHTMTSKTIHSNNYMWNGDFDSYSKDIEFGFNLQVGIMGIY